MSALTKLGILSNALSSYIKLTKNVVSNGVYFPRHITTTTRLNHLMEFFDEEKNWGAQDVKSGRSWKKEELRLKSNTDLHKLWYVLMKERNMLLTMEHESREKVRLFPSPERIFKVEEGMENLETVITERNKAYHQLETGETGQRPGRVTKSPLGLTYYYKECEYPIPKHMNVKWKQRHLINAKGKDLDEFLLKYREKLFLEKRKARNRNFNHVAGLLKRFPNMDMNALKEQYPDVDMDRVKNCQKSRGHFTPK